MSAGTGKSYEISGENTEWEDVLIRKGITTQDEVYLKKGLNPLDVRRSSPLFLSLSLSLSLSLLLDLVPSSLRSL
jgi:hypothetical protein